MKKLFAAIAIVVLSVFAWQISAYAFSSSKKMSATELQKIVEAKKQNVAIFDANDEDTRAKQGIVAGAKKLSSYNDYKLTELPEDKSTMLVFYCYNWLCPASHEAADRASGAGYTNVRVMSDGIMGWKSKGLPTSKS